MPLNSTLKSGRDGNFYVVGILSQFRKTFGCWILTPSDMSAVRVHRRGSSSLCVLRGCPGLPAQPPARGSLASLSGLVRAASAQREDTFSSVYKGVIGSPAAHGLCLPRGCLPQIPWAPARPGWPCVSAFPPTGSGAAQSREHTCFSPFFQLFIHAVST